MRFAAIEKSLVEFSTGPRDMTGNVQLYLAGAGRILRRMGAHIVG